MRRLSLAQRSVDAPLQGDTAVLLADSFGNSVFGTVWPKQPLSVDHSVA